MSGLEGEEDSIAIAACKISGPNLSNPFEKGTVRRIFGAAQTADDVLMWIPPSFASHSHSIR